MESDIDLSSECIFAASRSSGPGGQNINKVNTKVELRFNITDSKILNDSEKELLLEKLASRINQEGLLILSSQSERSQLKNKEKVLEKLHKLVLNALKPKKKRKVSKPSQAAIENRLKEKHKNAEKKASRQKPD